MRTWVKGIIPKYNYTDRNGEEKETYTLVELDGVKAERIGDAAGESHIEFVELVREPDIEGLDTEGVVLPHEQKMKLKLDTNPDRAVAVIRRIKDWAYNRSWSDVRIRINMPEKRSRLVSLAREADAADVLFVRSVRVDLESGIDQCTDTINEELKGKSIEIFQNE